MGYIGETESLLNCQFAPCSVHSIVVSKWFELVDDISCYIMLLIFLRGKEVW